MAYATQADLENAVGGQTLLAISDRDNNGVIDTGVIDAALSEASSLADSYLGAYLPITTVPEVLRRAVVDIAIYRLNVGVYGPSATDNQKLAFDQAVQWLRDVSKGLATLGLPEPTIDPGFPEVIAEERLWMRRSAGGIL